MSVFDVPDMPPNEVGRRLREIRAWRGQSLQVTAGLAGISYGYLGKLERGEKPVSNRRTLEALARALQVSPAEFHTAPWAGSPPDATEAARRGLAAVEYALDAHELGDDPECPVRDWPQIAADLDRLAHLTYGTSDYAEQIELVPRLLAELHAVHARVPTRRRDALVGLIVCYSSAVWTTKRLGGRGLPLLAARAAGQCAEELESPAWRGYAAWLRGDATGGLSRPEQYRRAIRTADELRPYLDDAEVVQASGMLHLSAALACAVQGDRDAATGHLAEAEALATRLDTEVGTFGHMWFGTANVGVWRVCIGHELGDGARIAEQARTVNVAALPSLSRQAEFHMEVGRALLTDPRRRDEGVQMLLAAERCAPQRFYADVFVREAVADHLRAARRDAGGRHLRGLAYRLRLAPELAP
ncbi:helix-turn-helix domain-containing protein [Nocardia paucivorans]|uniref:helix-turn-helix domain-containing protein n=1 Tax=Nocardia paucivorans TaxID=114259 RepID=UPI00068682C3|nr:helix-turn-helix domain-containing protein [Nocardia paucivorans]